MGPLAGIKVLDLSRILAGPWATQLLADLGATVWKIEKPGSGDDTRHWGPPWHEHEDQKVAAYFLAANRGKKSAAIDFARVEGAALIRSMAAQSDVLVENFKVGGLAKFGLDAASLRAGNPRLIYVSITGFGSQVSFSFISMFDCPEQIHTSPSITSDSVILFLPSIVIVYGPNDAGSGSLAFQ